MVTVRINPLHRIHPGSAPCPWTQKRQQVMRINYANIGLDNGLEIAIANVLFLNVSLELRHKITRLRYLLAVSDVIEHMELDEGLDMVDKAGVGGKNEQVTNDLVMKQTNKQTIFIRTTHCVGRAIKWPI